MAKQKTQYEIQEEEERQKNAAADAFFKQQEAQAQNMRASQQANQQASQKRSTKPKTDTGVASMTPLDKQVYLFNQVSEKDPEVMARRVMANKELLSTESSKMTPRDRLVANAAQVDLARGRAAVNFMQNNTREKQAPTMSDRDAVIYEAVELANKNNQNFVRSLMSNPGAETSGATGGRSVEAAKANAMLKKSFSKDRTKRYRKNKPEESVKGITRPENVLGFGIPDFVPVKDEPGLKAPTTKPTGNVEPSLYNLGGGPIRELPARTPLLSEQELYRNVVGRHPYPSGYDGLKPDYKLNTQNDLLGAYKSARLAGSHASNPDNRTNYITPQQAFGKNYPKIQEYKNKAKYTWRNNSPNDFVNAEQMIPTAVKMVQQYKDIDKAYQDKYDNQEKTALAFEKAGVFDSGNFPLDDYHNSNVGMARHKRNVNEAIDAAVRGININTQSAIRNAPTRHEQYKARTAGTLQRDKAGISADYKPTGAFKKKLSITKDVDSANRIINSLSGDEKAYALKAFNKKFGEGWSK